MLKGVGGGLGDAYLAIKPNFGRAAWLDTARCSVRWGRRQSIYQLIRLRGAGHHLRTVACYYWWTNHDDQCPCGQHRQDPPHWLFGCDRTARPRQKFHEWYAEMKGAREGARLAALPHQQ